MNSGTFALRLNIVYLFFMVGLPLMALRPSHARAQVVSVVDCAPASGHPELRLISSYPDAPLQLEPQATSPLKWATSRLEELKELDPSRAKLFKSQLTDTWESLQIKPDFEIPSSIQTTERLLTPLPNGCHVRPVFVPLQIGLEKISEIWVFQSVWDRLSIEQKGASLLYHLVYQSARAGGAVDSVGSRLYLKTWWDEDFPSMSQKEYLNVLSQTPGFESYSLHTIELDPSSIELNFIEVAVRGQVLAGHWSIQKTKASLEPGQVIEFYTNGQPRAGLFLGDLTLAHRDRKIIVDGSAGIDFFESGELSEAHLIRSVDFKTFDGPITLYGARLPKKIKFYSDGSLKEAFVRLGSGRVLTCADRVQRKFGGIRNGGSIGRLRFNPEGRVIAYWLRGKWRKFNE